MKRRLLTAREVQDLHAGGINSLELPPGALVTPGAQDLLRLWGIKVTYGAAPATAGPGGASGGPPPDDLAARVQHAVAALAPDLDPALRERVAAAVLAQLQAAGRGLGGRD